MKETYLKVISEDKKKLRGARGVEGHQVVRIVIDPGRSPYMEYFFGIPYLGRSLERRWKMDELLEARGWDAAIGVSKKACLRPEEVVDCIAYFERAYLKILDSLLAKDRLFEGIGEEGFLKTVDEKFENARKAMSRKHPVGAVDELRKVLREMGFSPTDLP